MKISIELSGQTYSYQSDHEGVMIDEIVTNFKGLLVAAGFHPQSVEQAISSEHCWFAEQTEPSIMNYPSAFANKHDPCTEQ